jgi:periplasmic divalent cation tolerance protein
MTDFIQVITTLDSEAAANQLASSIVSERLAACAQVVGPVTSTYWWEGTVESDTEWLCILKSSRDRFTELETKIRQVHPYDVPEILAVSVVAGNGDYLEWLRGELRSPSSENND